MKYIRISNKSAGVNRLHLEKLGLSTKRSDPDTIGQFGSGIKYAPISALRMNIDFVFVGFDDKGDYQLRYRSREEDGIQCVVYDYDTYVKESSFTIDAGTLSWDSEWQIYREVISNAKDNGEWRKELVDGIKQVPYEFAVYIRATPNMFKIYNDHEIYFSENREVIYDCEYNGVSFLKKYDMTERIYHKTVLVHKYNDNDRISLFDYCLKNAEMNEERALKYPNTERVKISKAIAQCQDKDLIKNYLLDKVINYNLIEFTEISEIHWAYTSPSKLWKECFHEVNGKNAVIVSPQQALIAGFISLVKTAGKRPIVVTTNAAFIFLTIGCAIDKGEDCISESAKFDIEEDVDQYPKLVEAMKIASFFEPGLGEMLNPLAVFKPNEEVSIEGITINMSSKEERKILISKDLAENGTIKAILATIIHEYDHYSSGITDSMFREFRNLADKRLSHLMLQLYKETPISLHKGEIKIKTIDLPLYGTLDYVIEYLPNFGWHLVRIGKLLFRLDSNHIIDSKSGVCSVDESGEHFIIKVPRDSQIKRVG